MPKQASLPDGDVFAGMQELLPTPPAHLAVAVSGGADSMALCLLTQKWAQQYNITLHALTVDHQLRPESTAEAEQVKHWLAAKGISHHTLTWQGKKPLANIQAAAREARYQLMADWCKQHHIHHLLLAHHLDDQAETFLIRLGRGSGIDGLAAMHPISHYNGLTLLRPLLAISKMHLIAFLRTHHQDWIEDPSNNKPQYTRTRMRAMLPQLAEAGISTATLATTASHMARARDYLEQQTKAAYHACAIEHEHGYIQLDDSAFRALHPEIGLRVLAMVLNRMNGTHLRPRFQELSGLYAHFGNVRTLNGCLFHLRKGSIFVHREAAALAPPKPIAAGERMVWDGRFTLQFPPDFPLQNASIGALGESGYDTIKAMLPSTNRIGRDKARLFPALWHLEKPLLVPHMQYVAEGAQSLWMRVTAFENNMNPC